MDDPVVWAVGGGAAVWVTGLCAGMVVAWFRRFFSAAVE